MNRDLLHNSYVWQFSNLKLRLMGVRGAPGTLLAACVVHIERLIKVTEATGNYASVPAAVAHVATSSCEPQNICMGICSEISCYYFH